MKVILGIGAILLGIWQLTVSKEYFNNIRKQSSPLIFAFIAVIASMVFAVALFYYGITALVSLR
ncbi:hypothetical protein FD29_GL001313 [Companilactobacillus mindensis DSM 14500]|uniref:DUF1146 domain-containing protein n=1 Tax=Companilactobacillus mindensis DSM 14500 TaxID=1423770 RepID=A0A0R1QEI7_9LACO|nr:hypothetical protein [Companilactobacillus mindensis]KRL43001.1 hypothetical protein FD29_GL001313 [Companilactobacillus mindensis DSM 14500]GEO78361.1 hypothetical protein LMI01_06920 [Companilactobacillus mindensis]